MPYCNICKRYDHWPKEHGWYLIEKACNPDWKESPFATMDRDKGRDRRVRRDHRERPHR